MGLICDCTISGNITVEVEVHHFGNASMNTDSSDRFAASNSVGGYFEHITESVELDRMSNTYAAYYGEVRRYKVMTTHQKRCIYLDQVRRHLQMRGSCLVVRQALSLTEQLPHTFDLRWIPQLY